MHRVPHRNQIQRKNWEMVSVAFLLFVPQSCAEGSKGCSVAQFCCGVAEFLQALSASSLWLSCGKQCGGSWWCCWYRAGTQKPAPVSSWGQLKTLPEQPPARTRVSHTLTSSPSAEVLGCVLLLPYSVWLKGWFGVCNEERKCRDLPKCCG